MMLGPLARVMAGALLALAVLVGVMGTRALLEARALEAEADVLLASNQLDLAIAKLRLAARWDAPLNFYADEAYRSLERIGASAESRGELERALAAYRSVHAAALASRGFYVPERERVRRADQRIAAILRRMEQPDAARPLDAASTLPDDLRPRFWGVLVAWLGFVSWVGGASLFMLRGVDPQGRLVRYVAKRSALCVLAGWIAFALGLRLA